MDNRIRELRKAKGITMKQLGSIVGLAESTISHYETGKRQLDKDTLVKLSHYFGVTIGYILGAEKSTLTEIGKRAESDFDLTQAERDLILKFRHLDDRGRSAVLTVLNHEYTALTGEETTSVPRQA